MFYLFKNTLGEIHNRCCRGSKKNVTELEDSNRNSPEQRDPREKKKRPSQGPHSTLRDDGLLEEGLGPDESGGTGRAPAASEPPRAPREPQGPRASLATSALMRRHLEPWEVREAFIYTPQIGQWRFEEEENPAGRSPESRPLSSW